MRDLPRTMRFMSTGALAALLLGAFMPSAVAQSLYCSEPSEPYCIDAYGTFDNDWSFRSCRDEVERYLEEVDRYAQCLIDEAQREIDDARREADDVIERFNCKAQGNTYCY